MALIIVLILESIVEGDWSASLLISQLEFCLVIVLYGVVVHW